MLGIFSGCRVGRAEARACDFGVGFSETWPGNAQVTPKQEAPRAVKLVTTCQTSMALAAEPGVP